MKVPFFARRSGALAMAGMLTLTLVSCGKTGPSKFDAVAYINGMMKENYLGEFDQTYLDLVNSTKEDSQKTYESNLDAEADFFLSDSCYGVENPSEELHAKVVDLYREIYKHSKFEVVSAAEQDDGSYSVKVTVEPINIVHLVEADWETSMEPFYTQYADLDLDSATEEQLNELYQAYGETIVSLYQTKLPEIGYLDPVSVSVQIEPDDDGLYTIVEDDFYRLDALIIDYNYVDPSTEER